MIRYFGVVLVAAFVASGCKGPTDPSHNIIEPPFSGTIQPVSTGPVHRFTVSNTGEFTVSVTALSPGNVIIGVLWGQIQGTNCGLIQRNVVDSTQIGKTVLSGSVQIKGDYCVVAFDASLSFAGYPALTVAQNYTLQVSHP